ncbi:choice-of-anchor I family protein [Alkalihalobacillus oceani]|uniref:Choice-of-anchor I family protein n=1 Tax=Halalkalibacter oceani TaxID=1653776 RepID=A0A9X2DUQ2_9BACI|nr:choice-of-anchor I family protein [Halalkalibacter oceani]MCM3715813.1 choice-of-anchor I family protein [Halalkalibacter oceani]
MKKLLTGLTLAGTLLFSVQPYHVLAEAPPFVQYGQTGLHVSQLAQYDSRAGEGGTEILAYDAASQKAFVTNGAEAGLDILSFAELTSGEFRQIESIRRIHVADFGLEQVEDITSVASHPSEDLIALAVVSNPKTDPGYIVFLTKSGDYLTHVQVGALPDMVTFSPDGTKALVANEGEPNDDYSVDPEGSVSIIDLTAGVAAESSLNVNTLLFDEKLFDENVRVSSKGSVEQQIEPEYIVVSEDSSTAYVALQENNAVAIIDLQAEKVTAVKGLGEKDHSIPGNELDGKEDGEINIENLPLLGWRMPDAIDTFSVNGQTYIVTPNEGDARDYDAYSEEVKIGEILDQIELNAEHYQGYSQEELDELVEAGLLESMEDTLVTAENGKNDQGIYEALYSFGGRSFSIFNADTMELVYDSGAEFEQIMAEAMPEHFNTTNDKLQFDGRSDAKGPEPETVVTGQIGDSIYAFIALERFGAIMVYDVTDPEASEFVTMISSRDFTVDVGGDVSPEGLVFIDAADSPTGYPLLSATHEISGTVAVYEIQEQLGEPTPIPDVEQEHEAYSYIMELLEREVIDAGEFRPAATLTREDLVVMVSRGLGLEPSDQSGTFTDVHGENASLIQAAYEAGIVNGTADHLFAPEEFITREQMAVIFTRAFHYINEETVETSEVEFMDDEQISGYAKAAAQYAVDLGWMKATEEEFQPKANSSRAEAAEMISLFLNDL